MKLKVKVPGKKNIEKKSEELVFDFTGGSLAPVKTASFGITEPEADAFTVSVRNAEPLIRRLDIEKEHAAWVGDIQVNLAAAGILMAFFGLFFMAAGIPELILFSLPGFLVYMLFAMLGSFDDDKVKRIRLYVAAAGAIALIAMLVVFHRYIGSGWALIMNQLYDTGETAQAYIYDRFHVGSAGEEHPYRSMHFAAIWGSCLAGLITAVPPARFRRPVAMTIAAFSMLAFAYYGILPSWICIAVLAVAILFLLSRGSIMSSLTILLAMVIVFGVITLADPGENYGISRADETFRDRFALISSYLESNSTPVDGLDELERQMQEQQEQQEDGVFMDRYGGITALIVVLLVLVAIAVATAVVCHRIRKRQQKNRAGLDSRDPRTAIVAMFPYTIKWLQPAGIEPQGKPFETLVPVIRADVSEEYADRYTEMYELWKEAAYSDHEMTEDGRSEMNSFMTDTMNMIREKSDLKTRLVNTIKYAL